MIEKIIIVSHTHWDREWYQTFQEYRLRLVKTLDKLLNILQKDLEFKHFLLDGQVVPMEDYLEVRPDKKELFLGYVKEGRISIGPWYIQPDEWLSFPESLIRNLIFGEKMAKELGLRVMKVGYTPDSFGHTAQMPQIFKGFNIDSFIFMRGLGDEELGSEFLWEAPDGSRVFSCWLSSSYSNGVFLGSFVGDPSYFYINIYPSKTIIWKSGFFPFTQYYTLYDEEPEVDEEKAIKHLEEIIKLTKNRSKCLLVLNGADHSPPQESLSKIIRALKLKFKDLEQGKLEDYIEEVKKVKDLPVYKGELRGAKYEVVLPNILSSRIPQIKIPSFYVQNSITYYLEPLLTLNWILGKDYPKDLLNYLWKLILKTLPHDSICGCSVDETHKDVENRLKQANEIIRSLVLENLIYFAKRVNTKEVGTSDLYILVFNPLNWVRNDVLELYAEVPYSSYEVDGEPVIVEEVKDYPHFRSKRLLKLKLLVKDVPPLGFTTLKLSKRSSNIEVVVKDKNRIENEFFVVEVEKGGILNIIDKLNKVTYKSMLVDEGDAGDEYNFSPPYIQKIYTSEDVSANVTSEETPLYSCLRISYNMKIPKALENGKRSEELVDLPVSIKAYLYKGIKRIDVKLNLENKAKDHRLKLLFKTGLKVEKSYADTHFYVIERSTNLPLGEDWAEKPSGDYPMLRWVCVSDGEKGLTVSTHGLHEYNLEPNGNLYITLLRSIGYLSRERLLTRPSLAGPLLATPEAQCIGNYEFNYSIIPHKGDWREAYKEAMNFSLPLIGIVTDYHEGDIKPKDSILELKPDSLHVTCIKKGEYDNSLILRFYDNSGLGGKVNIKAGIIKLKNFERVKLSEESLGKEELDYRPWEIVTFKLFTN